jgi:hypothetical protein
MHPVRNLLSLPLAMALALAFALPTAALAKDLLRIRVDLVNTGVEPSADGKAELRIKKKNRMRFKVEAEDLQPANYDVVVDGVVRGVLDVRQQPDGEVEGEIEFDTKREPGKLPLSFDPRGKLVTIERAATIYLQVVFPNS